MSECHYCKTTFKNKYNLLKHQKTARFCLQIQNKESQFEYSCEYCNKMFTRKDNYIEHKGSCKIAEQKKYDDLQQQLQQANENINNLKNTIKGLESFKIYKSLYEEEKTKNNKLQEDYTKLSHKAIEKAGTVKTTINNRNQIYQALYPLTDEYMKEQSKYLTYKNVKNGTEGIAHFASNHTFKDRLFCSDVSRLNFVFKNENDVIIKDPEGIEITKKFIDINRDELLRLTEQYFEYVQNKIDDPDLDEIELKFWLERRSDIYNMKAAINRGNIPENTDNYNSFKRAFLIALSGLIPR